jgi:WD40 repeat protein
LVSAGQVLVTVEKLGGLPDISAVVRTRFWDLPSGELRQEIFDPQGYEDIYVSTDGTYFAIQRGICPNETGKACGVEVWSIPANKQVLDLDLEYIAKAAFSTDNRWLALSTREEIQLWDLVHGELIAPLPGSYRFDKR